MKTILFFLIFALPVHIFAQTEREIIDSLAKRYDREFVTLSGAYGFSKNDRDVKTQRDHDALFANSPSGRFLYEKYKKKSRLPKMLAATSLVFSITGLFTYPKNQLLGIGQMGVGSAFCLGAMITMAPNQRILERAVRARNREVIFGQYKNIEYDN